ncbi:MAG: ribose-phosphate pyrophosphokinase [Francisellaceae bacterium]|jgi:ribose-phosphate pyrophosphokinase|nr:ribose-phosphate pyrophosphokinase [Francisellaceae bacterium]MBT6537938.1 ribose-phosphate pyrophosphokinase [Francisellaceae bacterium]
MSNPEMLIFSGNSNKALTASLCNILHIEQSRAKVGRFSDGEISVNIMDNVRGKDVFIIQPTCAPTNDNLMELLLIADAIRRASAHRITAVVPYFGYARQDRRVRSSRVPISAKLVADMISTADVNRVLTIDLHAEQIQGFFSIPVDNAFSSAVMLNDIEKKNYKDIMIVSPDVGGVIRARAFSKRLNHADMAIIDKRRPRDNEVEYTHIIGNVEGRQCIIVDDIIDTAGTLCMAAEALKNDGAISVSAYCTHPIFSGNAVDNINKSSLDEVVVTDTIPLREDAINCPKIKTLSIAPMLAEAMKRVHLEESISCMFN